MSLSSSRIFPLFSLCCGHWAANPPARGHGTGNGVVAGCDARLSRSLPSPAACLLQHSAGGENVVGHSRWQFHNLAISQSRRCDAKEMMRAVCTRHGRKRANLWLSQPNHKPAVRQLQGSPAPPDRGLLFSAILGARSCWLARRSPPEAYILQRALHAVRRGGSRVAVRFLPCQ